MCPQRPNGQHYATTKTFKYGQETKTEKKAALKMNTIKNLNIKISTKPKQYCKCYSAAIMYLWNADSINTWMDGFN